MKTKEELKEIKKEIDALNKKLGELNEAELAEVTGGDVTSANVVGYPMNNGEILTAGYGGSGSMIHAPTFDKDNLPD